MKKIVLIIIVFLSLVSNAQVKNVLVPYRKASLWGFSDSNGKIVIAPVYDSITLFDHCFNREKHTSINFSKVYQNKKIGILSNKDTLLLPIQYTKIEQDRKDNRHSDRFFVTDSNGKVGLIDFYNIYIPSEFESIKGVRNNSYIVQKNGRLGLVDYYGKIVIPIVYNQLQYVSNDDDLFKWKVINEQETKYVFTSVFIDNDDFSIASSISIPPSKKRDEDTSLQYKISSKYNLVTKHSEYNYAYIFIEGRKNNYKYGFMNAKSKNTLRGNYSELEFLYDYYNEKTSSQHFVLKVKENEKFGIIDETGKIIAPTIHKEIEYNNDYYKLKLDNLIGFYFQKNNQYFEAKYKGYVGYLKTFHNDNSPDFSIIGVYENSEKDWYYIGENGVVFKE